MVDSLKNLVVKQAMVCFTPTIVQSLPEDIQTILRQNMGMKEQIFRFRGEVIRYWPGTIRKRSLVQYNTFYTLGEQYCWHENGQLASHGYWYKGYPIWEHKTWNRRGKLTGLKTYNKQGEIICPIKDILIRVATSINQSDC